MSQFDYFSEIEESFVRRRGSNLILSPVDWSLIESWEDQGIPLKIVLSAIQDVFERIEAEPGARRDVRTLSYCREAVESRYKGWRDSQAGKTGGSPAEDSGGDLFPPAAVRSHLEKCFEVLGELAEHGDALAADEALKVLRNVMSEDQPQKELAEKLDALDDRVDELLASCLEPDELQELADGVRDELRRMEATTSSDVFESTVRAVSRRRLRERSGIPKLGLYYL